MVDIAKLSANDRTTFKVYVLGGLTADGKGDLPDSAGFVVVGPNSVEFQKAQAVIGAKSMRMLRERQASAEAAEEAKKEPDAAPPDDEATWTENQKALMDRSRIIAEACTVDFFGFTVGDTEVSFSPQALAQILDARKLWGFMASRAIENEANFTKG